MKESAPVAGEEMTREEAISRGLVPMTRAEVESLRSLTGRERQAFIARKLAEHRLAQKARFHVELKDMRETHPLGRLDVDDRKKERNRLKRLRRNRAGR